MADLALVTANKVNIVSTQQQHTFIAGSDLTAGALCRINTSGKAVVADGSAAGTADVWGMATRTVKSGEAVTLLRRGFVDGYELAGLAYGAKVYLSDTDSVGVPADAAGTVSVVVGRVVPAYANSLSNSPDKILGLEINQ